MTCGRGNSSSKCDRAFIKQPGSAIYTSTMGQGAIVSSPSGAVSPPVWVPGDYANLEYYLDVRKSAVLFTTSGSTQATNDGDPVARTIDSSSKGRNTFLPDNAPANRPLLKTSGMVGGRRALKWDGLDDYAPFITPFAFTGPQTFVFDLQITAIPPSDGFFAAFYFEILSGTTTMLYVMNHSSYQSYTFCFGFSGLTQAVGFGGFNAAGLDTGRNELQITYNGGADHSDPNNYSAVKNGVVQTVTTSNVIGQAGTGGALGSRSDGSISAAMLMSRMAIYSAEYKSSQNRTKFGEFLGAV